MYGHFILCKTLSKKNLIGYEDYKYQTQIRLTKIFQLDWLLQFFTRVVKIRSEVNFLSTHMPLALKMITINLADSSRQTLEIISRIGTNH